MRRLAATIALLALTSAPAAAAPTSSATLEIAPVDGGPRTLVVRAPESSDGFGRPAWSRDGSTLSVIGEGRTMTRGDKQLLRYPAIGGAPETASPLVTGYTATLSPDGTTLAELTDEGTASGRGGMVLRDVATGAVRVTVPQWAEGDDLYESEPEVCWSTDGRRAAIEVAERRDGAVHVVDVPSGRTLLRRSTRLGGVASTRCFAPDGRRLLLRNGRRLVIVDAETGGARTLPSWGRFVESAVWSPDGGRIAIGSGGDLALVDPITGWGPSYAVGGTDGLAWSPDGRALAFRTGGGDDSTGDDGPQTLSVVQADRFDAPRALVSPRRDDLGPFAWSPDGARIAITTWRYRR
ncbi:MAG TPA: hypothetical protein VN238_02995 [Solirubrobacteraceae bacterium]|nr:hypothetical protein [Solirubrobacteraceae bacterium]